MTPRFASLLYLDSSRTRIDSNYSNGTRLVSSKEVSKMRKALAGLNLTPEAPSITSLRESDSSCVSASSQGLTCQGRKNKENKGGLIPKDVTQGKIANLFWSNYSLLEVGGSCSDDSDSSICGSDDVSEQSDESNPICSHVAGHACLKYTRLETLQKWEKNELIRLERDYPEIYQLFSAQLRVSSEQSEFSEPDDQFEKIQRGDKLFK